MAVTSTPACVQNPKITPQQILPADASGKKTVATGGTNGSKVVAILVASTDTSVRVIQLFLTRSATNYLIGSASIPAGAGNDGTLPSVNLLGLTLNPGLPVDNDGEPYLFLESGDTLSVATTTTVTAAKEIDIHAIFGNF